MGSLLFSGVRIDSYSLEEVVARVLGNDGENLTVFTPNVDHIIRLNSDAYFREVYNRADIIVNDSRVLKLLGRLFNIEFNTVVPGSDLTRELLKRVSGTKRSVSVIGCSDLTIKEVKKSYGLNCLNHYNPPMGFINSGEEVDKCIRFLLENPSDIVLLCVGSPRQEVLADLARRAGVKGAVLSVGASLLFLSGEEKRAPLFIRKMSLEWFYRLAQSPRRLFKRYLIDGPQILKVFWNERNNIK